MYPQLILTLIATFGDHLHGSGTPLLSLHFMGQLGRLRGNKRP